MVSAILPKSRIEPKFGMVSAILPKSRIEPKFGMVSAMKSKQLNEKVLHKHRLILKSKKKI